MTKQIKTDQAVDNEAQRTGLSWTVWLLFFAVVAGALAADLGLKYWSFQNVPQDFQVRVQTAEAGGPEVLVRLQEGEQWLVAHENGMTDSPQRVPSHDPVEVIPGLLNLQLTLNTGAVFGMGQGARPMFIAVSIVALVVILFLLYRSPRNGWLYHVGLALILGGALGNLYDRVFYSAVRDMLHMLPSTGLWPWIFNPADVALLAGVGMVLVVSWMSEHQAARQAKAAKAK